MALRDSIMGPLAGVQVKRFLADGFVRLDDGFTKEQAAKAASVLFRGAGIDADDPSTWRGPILRIEGSTDPAVVATINTGRVVDAIDQLLGEGNWLRRSNGFGTFPIRFPSGTDPGDTGWHIDGSFGEPPSYQVNLASRGRALLLLMLFTDVGLQDAPTRIRVGSHCDVARALEQFGKDVTFSPELHAPSVLDLPIENAIGPAGTVHICHPFLVHAASWPHTGRSPRVIGQPAVHHPEGEWAGGFDYNAEPDSPVKQAVRQALRQS